ncbi:MAG: DinB family protein [Bacteroidota bacterium]
MKKSFSLLLVCLLMSAGFAKLNAQGLSFDTLKAQFIKDWERAKAYTGEYLATMPADKFSFRAQDSIRTFAQQMLHLSMGNLGLGANGTGATAIFGGFNMEKSPTAQNKDSVTYYVNASYDFVINGLKAMDAAKLGETQGRFTRYVWVMKTFEHQTHHRGQCTIYIRLLGIKPPNERLF